MATLEDKAKASLITLPPDIRDDVDRLLLQLKKCDRSWSMNKLVAVALENYIHSCPPEEMKLPDLKRFARQPGKN